MSSCTTCLRFTEKAHYYSGLAPPGGPGLTRVLVPPYAAAGSPATC